MRILLSAIYPYIFLLLYLTIPFDDYVRAMPNIILITLVVVFPFVVKKTDFKKLRSFPFVMYFVFVLYLVLNALIFHEFMEDISIISKVLIALGMAVLYIPVNDVDKIKGAMIFSSLMAIAYSVYHFVLITHDMGYFALGDSPQVVESLLIDRMYLGMLSVLSVLISYEGIKKTYHPNNNYHLANIAINIAFVLLIGSKISLLALLVLFVVRQCYGKKKVWKAFLAVVAGVAIVGLFLVVKNQDSDYFHSEKTPKVASGFINHSLTYELRATVWECAAQVAENEKSFWSGIGFKNTEDKLVTCYSETITNPKKRDDFIGNRYNTHNQFLGIYLGAGIIGLVLFVMFIGGGIYAVRKNYFPTAMLVLLVVYCLFENVFHRQIGAYYVGAIMLMGFMALGNNAHGKDDE